MAPLVPHRIMVIPVIGAVQERTFRMHRNASYVTLKKIIEPYLEGDTMDHRAVYYDGGRRDLFVGEMANTHTEVRWSAIRNVRATEILRAHFRLLHPEEQAWEPVVCGPAVLFPDARIWF